MKGVKKLLNLLEKALITLMTVLLASMTIVICYQVVLRYFFHDANIWAEEFARFAFVWMIMMGSVVAIRRFKHLTIDFLIQLAGPKLRKVLNLFSYVLIMVFLGFLLVYGIELAQKTGNQLSSGMKIPMSYMYLSIPFGSGLMMLYILEHLWDSYIVTARGNKQADEDDKAVFFD